MYPHPQEPKQNNTLYIGDLEHAVSEPILHSYFVKFGPIYTIRILRDIQSKLSRGFGFVTYYNHQDAVKAQKEANHAVIFQKPIRVTWKKNIHELSPENNIFVKNIPLTITEQELEKAFQVHGPIFSCKISYNEQGVSRGYGYIQYESQDAAKSCLQSPAPVFDSHHVEIQSFTKKNSRPQHQENNLYMKNLPALNLKELEHKLIQLCKPFGTVTSILVKEDSNKRPFAFVCFQEHDQAQRAFETLNNKDVFNHVEPLYVNWAMKKSERQAQLQKEYMNQLNETNVFTRNIKNTVNLNVFQQAFAQIGQTVSCMIRPASVPGIKTQFGFVSFPDRETCFKCLIDGPKHPAIQALFEEEKVYLNLAMPKQRYEQFRRSKQAHQLNYLKSRRMPQLDQKTILTMQQQIQNSMSKGQMMAPLQMLMPQFQQMFKNQMGIHKPQHKRNHPRQPRKKSDTKVVPKYSTISEINSDMKGFSALDIQKQRTILGELLYPKIKELVDDQTQTPRITGMLIDLEVFEISDIIEIINSKGLLQERISEAMELIKQESQ